MSVDISSRLINLIWSHPVIWENATMTWAEAEIEDHLLNVGEAIPITDAKAAEIAKAISQQFSAGDMFDRVVVVSRGFGESLALTGEYARAFFKAIEDDFAAGGAVTKAGSKALIESATVAENETDPTDYRRHYYESFQVADAIVKHLEKRRTQNITLVDSFIGPNVPGVISDVAIKNTIVTEGQIDPMVNKGSAFGFGDWIPFVDGEYYYREALFKMTIKNTKTGTINSVKIPSHKLTCDVYEIVDKGSGAISSSNADGTEISFNKTFRQAPIVTLTLSTSPDGFCVPQIVSVSSSSVTVKLVKPDGTLATGGVMWNAVGF